MKYEQRRHYEDPHQRSAADGIDRSAQLEGKNIGDASAWSLRKTLTTAGDREQSGGGGLACQMKAATAVGLRLDQIQIFKGLEKKKLHESEITIYRMGMA